MVKVKKSETNGLDLFNGNGPEFFEMDLAISCLHGGDHEHWAHSFPFYLLGAYFQKAILFSNANELGAIKNNSAKANWPSNTSNIYLKLKRFHICLLLLIMN